MVSLFGPAVWSAIANIYTNKYVYIFAYMLAIAGQKAGPNRLTFF